MVKMGFKSKIGQIRELVIIATRNFVSPIGMKCRPIGNKSLNLATLQASQHGFVDAGQTTATRSTKDAEGIGGAR